MENIQVSEMIIYWLDDRLNVGAPKLTASIDRTRRRNFLKQESVSKEKKETKEKKIKTLAKSNIFGPPKAHYLCSFLFIMQLHRFSPSQK